jgi:hypothetical protein
VLIQNRHALGGIWPDRQHQDSGGHRRYREVEIRALLGIDADPAPNADQVS